jgi:hypothetical protein
MSILKSKNWESYENTLSKETIELTHGTENAINVKPVTTIQIKNIKNVNNTLISSDKRAQIQIRNIIVVNKIAIKIKIY